MFRDEENRYRPILLNDPPQLLDRVNTPWDTLPDLESYNGRVFNRIVRALRSLTPASSQQPPRLSEGLLILGEAGTGKTHLLMRVAKNLCKTNHILFVRRPNNEEAVAQHVWKNIVDSLAQKLPATDGERSQLDDLLAHVFSKVLIPVFEEDIRAGKNTPLRRRWIDKLSRDPYSLFHMLGSGEQRQKNLNIIRKRTLKFLRDNSPNVDQHIAGVLITYCLVADQDRKRVLLNWLAGQDLDPSEAQNLGLPASWVPTGDETPEVAVWQQREEIALRAISSIGHLSTYYQPLILAFDQLEGLRDQERLTRRWGDVLREVFTMSPNYLILTCVFPSLWREWFSNVLDRSVLERIAQQQVTLDQFGPEHGMQMLAIHLRESFRKHHLPNEIFPFEKQDVLHLCQGADSPRAFLQATRAQLENWLDGMTVTPAAAPSSARAVTHDEIYHAIGKAAEALKGQVRKEYARSMLLPEDFFGRIKDLLTLLVRAEDPPMVIDKATYRARVMPFNLLLIPRHGTPRVCIAVLNGESSSLTARLRNLLGADQDLHQFDGLIMIRDARLRSPGQRGQEYLEQLLSRGHVFIPADEDEVVAINTAYDTLVAVEQRDLAADDYRIEKAELVHYYQNTEQLADSSLFRHVAEVFPSLLPALKTTVGGAAAARHEPALPPPPFAKSDAATGPEIRRRPAYSESRPGSLARPMGETASRHAAAASDEAIEALSHAAIPATNPDKSVDVLVGDRTLDSPHVGVLGTFLKDRRRLAISLTKPQGIVLVGYMGSGKSYALGVLIENAILQQPPLIRQTRPMAVVCFNYRSNEAARFEYGGFRRANNRPNEVAALEREYGGSTAGIPSVNVLAYPDELPRRRGEYADLRALPLQFRSEELSANHWEILMKAPQRETEYMNVIRDIIQKLHYQQRLTLDDLEQEVRKDDRLSSSQLQRAVNRLIFARRWISDRRPYHWSDLLQEGSLTIVDLRMQMLQPTEALKLCLVTTDLIRRAKNGVNKLIVFDEAHEYVHNRELVEDLENALTQIRHDGMSFVFASQYPTRIPRPLFRYLLTRFIFKIPDQAEIEYLRNMTPSLQALAAQAVANLGLEQGACFLQTDDECSDARLRSPQIIRMRPRCSLHAGQTVRQV